MKTTLINKMFETKSLLNAGTAFLAQSDSVVTSVSNVVQTDPLGDAKETIVKTIVAIVSAVLANFLQNLFSKKFKKQ